MRRFMFAIAAALTLGGGVAFAQMSPAPSAAPSPAPAASPISTIHIKNFAYVPDHVTINAGQRVRFVQDDETPHTVTAVDKSFDSGNLDQHKTWTHTFDKPGTYAYLCAYHSYMRGTVTVK